MVGNCKCYRSGLSCTGLCTCNCQIDWTHENIMMYTECPKYEFRWKKWINIKITLLSKLAAILTPEVTFSLLICICLSTGRRQIHFYLKFNFQKILYWVLISNFWQDKSDHVFNISGGHLLWPVVSFSITWLNKPFWEISYLYHG